MALGIFVALRDRHERMLFVAMEHDYEEMAEGSPFGRRRAILVTTKRAPPGLGTMSIGNAAPGLDSLRSRSLCAFIHAMLESSDLQLV
jgi:hypothetical protein